MGAKLLKACEIALHYTILFRIINPASRRGGFQVTIQQYNFLTDFQHRRR
jgi:hypothetical protein